MIKPALLQAPIAYPISLTDAKAHLRVDHDDDDGLINALIAAATNHLDGYGGILGKCLMQQKWRISADRFCNQQIRLPFSKVVSLEVKYTDSAALERVVDDAEFELLEDSLGAYVMLSVGFPEVALANTEDPAWIEIVCGAEDADGVPSSIAQAMKMMIAHWYENRSGENPNRGLPAGVEALLAPHRKWRL